MTVNHPCLFEDWHYSSGRRASCKGQDAMTRNNTLGLSPSFVRTATFTVSLHLDSSLPQLQSSTVLTAQASFLSLNWRASNSHNPILDVCTDAPGLANRVAHAMDSERPLLCYLSHLPTCSHKSSEHSANLSTHQLRMQGTHSPIADFSLAPCYCSLTFSFSSQRSYYRRPRRLN